MKPMIMINTLLVAVMWSLTVAAPPAAEQPKPHRQVPFYQQIPQPDREIAAELLEATWETLGSDRWPALQEQARQLLLARLVYGRPDDESYVSYLYFYLLADWLPRLADLDLEPKELLDYQRWLILHPQITAPLLLALSPEDDALQAAAVIQELCRHNSDAVLHYPELAIAAALDYDRRDRDTAQLTAQFDWWTGKRPWALPVEKLPQELARYLYPSDISSSERQGVYDFYAATTDMNQVYRDVIYDFDALLEKQPPRLTGKPRSIENLLVYGSTCTDQTYAAVQVGRAKGYPMVELVFHGPGVVGHSWAAQFLGQKEGPLWNAVGAIPEAYPFGWTFDPATGQRESQQTLGFLGAYVQSAPTERWISLGLARLADRTADLIAEKKVDYPAELFEKLLKRRAQPHHPDQDHLDYFKPQPQAKLEGERIEFLLQRSYERCAFQPELWRSLVRLARGQHLSAAATIKFIDQLAKMTRGSYRDKLFFVLLEIAPALDRLGQERFLDAAANWVNESDIRRAPTLVAEIFLLAGDITRQRGDIDKAIELYIRAISLKPDYGPVSIPALMRLLPLLKDRADELGVRRELDLLLAASNDPLFQLQLLPATVQAGDKQAALERLITIVEDGDPEQRGYYTAARQAIELMVEMQETGWALSAAKNLYQQTRNHEDGQRVVRIMRVLGQNELADQAEKEVEEFEKERLAEIERQAELRRQELRERHQ
ncbi:MAG: hypothetical protein HJJLKODD_02065 [Phycisphaerae bacterium]|nr:hypothetical protein [Phycisphaerae bacterium]